MMFSMVWNCRSEMRAERRLVVMSEGGAMVRFVGAALIVAVLAAGCGMPLTKRDMMWTGEPETALDKMLFVLEELGYTILDVNKADGILLAEKVPGDEAFMAALSETKANPYKVSITVREREDRCLIKVTVSQPGESIKGGTDELADEIIEKFEELAGEVEVLESK
jgi:hypothetical protein